MLREMIRETRQEIRKLSILERKHIGYLICDLPNCPYIKISYKDLQKRKELLNKKLDLLFSIREFIESKETVYKFVTNVEKYYNNIKNTIIVIKKFKSFVKENFNEDNLVSLETLYSKEDLENLYNFFKRKYGIDLRNEITKVKIFKINFEEFYSKVGTPFYAAYLAGGKYKKSIMITERNSFISNDKIICGPEYFVHEMTHYLQYTLGYAKVRDMIKCSLANIHLMITGDTKYYMNNKLEADARFNQKDYNHFVETGKLKREDVVENLFNKLYDEENLFN